MLGVGEMCPCGGGRRADLSQGVQGALGGQAAVLGLVPISPSEGTQWGHDGDRRSCHGFWPPITRTRGQEGEGVPPAGVPRSGGDAEGPPRPRASFGKPQPHGSRAMQEDAAGSGAAPMGSALWGGMRGPSVGSLPSPPAAGGSPHVALWGRWAGCPGWLSHAPAGLERS